MVLLSRKEAAARLDISVATLDAERRDGNLEYIQRRPNGKVWISEEAVAAYPEKNEVTVSTSAQSVQRTLRGVYEALNNPNSAFYQKLNAR